MPIQLEANYCKKLGLPGYSSHHFSLTVRMELPDATQVQAESSRLYALLQSSVDREIQETGFVPDESNGSANGHSHHARAMNRLWVDKPPDGIQENEAQPRHQEHARD